MKYRLLLVLLLGSVAAFGQFDENYKDKDNEGPEVSYLNLGVGIGQGYGGIGGRITGFPAPVVGLFGAVGFNLHQPAWNLGGVLRANPKRRAKPTFIAMYGYNAVIVIAGASQYNKTYLGPSFGGGCELHLGNGKNFLNFELIIPIRSEEYKSDIRDLKNNSGIELTEPLPFTIGFGYHIKF